MQVPTYYVQFASPEEVGHPSAAATSRWHTIARVNDRMLAEEIARLAETGYLRTTMPTRYVSRVVSRSALRREGGLPHADWQLGSDRFRSYGEGLRAKAEQNLQPVSTSGLSTYARPASPSRDMHLGWRRRSNGG